MSVSRRNIIKLASLGVASLAAAPVFAQSDRPVRFIVPSPPGTAPDASARFHGENITRMTQTAVVVENIPGAAGMIGASKFSRMPADDHTFLWGFNQIATINPVVQEKMGYDPDTFEPVILTTIGSYVWLVHSGLPIYSISDLVSYAKSQDKPLTYASTGYWAASHLGGLLLEKKAGIKMTHVPYSSSSNPDLMGGNVDIKLETVTAATSMLATGKVRAIAVSGPRRTTNLPDVPTVSETFPGYDITGWQAVWASAGTSSKVTENMYQIIRQSLMQPNSIERSRTDGNEIAAWDSRKLDQIILKERNEWKAFISSLV